jgi:hypothetical protein
MKVTNTKSTDPSKAVLRSFQAEIEAAMKIQSGFSAPIFATSFLVQDCTPNFNTDEFIPQSKDSMEKEKAYMLLYADAWNFRAYMHRPKPQGTPDYYRQLALPVYQQWRQEEKEVFHRKCIQIPEPASGESLAEYLQQLAFAASEGNEHRDVWVESLCCFLQFLREDMALDQKGFLEILFPSHESCKGLEFRKGYSIELKDKKPKKVERRYILRRIEKTVYPIDILAASDILMNLILTVLEGRPNAQRSAAEALGFAWLCHAVGCYRLVTREDLIFNTEITSLKPPDENQPKEWFHPTHFIGITSLYGTINVPISKILYEFLLALPRDQKSNRIFNMDLDTVRRTFRNKGVKQSAKAQHLGQITFLTFMSQPHEAIGHRPLLKKIRSKPKKKLSSTKQSE